MSMTIEVRPLDELGISLQDAPPCECLHGKELPRTPCGAPAAGRILVSCSCGGGVLAFMCAECILEVQQHKAQCGHCLGTGYEWRNS